MPASPMTGVTRRTAWLRSIGEGDIIKNDVTVSFSAGQDNMAGSVVEDLRQQWTGPRTENPHPSANAEGVGS